MIDAPLRLHATSVNPSWVDYALQILVGRPSNMLRSGRLPCYRAMLDSADAWEGPWAFADRRVPVWEGR